MEISNQRHNIQQKTEALGRVIEILDILRVKCPWDAKQTNESLRPNTIEEVYELTQALLDENDTEIKKELGDVLLHVLFYSKIGEENGTFDITDVCNALADKLIFRHPHVFGQVQVKDSHDVEMNWEQIKLKEKGGNRSVLAGVPATLPALIKAFRIQEKAANVGFDWENRDDVFDKLAEEFAEVKEAVASKNQNEVEEEFGDLLFAVVNAARLYGVTPENALERTNRKFISRFNHIEKRVKEHGRDIKELTLAELDVFWDEAKKLERDKQ